MATGFEDLGAVEVSPENGKTGFEDLGAVPVFSKSLTSSDVQQSSGEVPTISKLKKLLPTKEELPEFLATTAAGIASTGAKIIPAAGLMGLAAAGGEGYKQTLQSLGLLEGEPPATISERLKNMAKAGLLRGIPSELLGRTISKLFHPFSGGVTPVIEKQLEKSVINEPPISVMTESKTPQVLERFVEVSPFGEKITQQKRIALRELEDFSDTVGKVISPDKPAEFVGAAAEQNVQNFQKVFRETKDKLYDAVMPLVKDQKPILDDTINTLKDIVERRTSLGQPSEVKTLSGFFDSLEKGEVKTFEDLRKFRTNITGEILPLNKTGRTGIARDYEILRDAITRDLDATASALHPDIASGIKDADKFYSQGINKLKDRLIGVIQRTAEREPSKLDKVLIREDSPELAQAGREILGEETFQDVKKQWFNKLIKNSTKIIEGEEVISPALLSNNIRKMGTTVPELFSNNSAEMAVFDRLNESAKLLSRGREITAGSQTAYLQNLSQMFNIFNLPQTALTATAALAVRTGLGREYLTRGYPILGKIAQRIIQPAAQLGLQKSQDINTVFGQQK